MAVLYYRQSCCWWWWWSACFASPTQKELPGNKNFSHLTLNGSAAGYINIIDGGRIHILRCSVRFFFLFIYTTTTALWATTTTKDFEKYISQLGTRAAICIAGCVTSHNVPPPPPSSTAVVYRLRKKSTFCVIVVTTRFYFPGCVPPPPPTIIKRNRRVHYLGSQLERKTYRPADVFHPSSIDLSFEIDGIFQRNILAAAAAAAANLKI